MTTELTQKINDAETAKLKQAGNPELRPGADIIEVLEAVRLWEVESTYSRKHFTIEERADAIDAAIIAVKAVSMLQRRIEQLENILSQR